MRKLTWSALRHWRSRQGGRRPVSPRALLNLECLEDRTLMSVNVAGGFSGLAFDLTQGATPPDTQVAIGPSSIGEAVNTNLEFFNKSGGTLFQGSFASLFSPIRADAGHSTVMSDPSIHYDADNGRFVLTILDLDETANQAYLDIAVSTNNHPSQPADFLAAQINVTENAATGSPNPGTKLWTDFDRYGSSANAYVFTFNMFTLPISSQSLFDHVQVLAISKSAILSATPSFVTHTVDLSGWNGTNIVNENLSPADMHGAQSTDPMYFVEEASYGSATNTQLRVLKVANILTASASNFQSFNVTVPTYTTNQVVDSAHPWNSGDVNANARQLGSSDQMQTNDTRVLSVAWRRDSQGVEHLLATQEVGATLARARWYEFITSSTSPTLNQSGDVGAAGAASYYPSIDIAPDGTIGLDFLESSSSEYMSMYVTGRTPSDPLNTMETPKLAQAGQAGYTLGGFEPSPHRAGDFSGIGMDIDASGNPLNSFWAANEYTGAGGAWATWLSNFSVPPPPVVDLNWSAGGITGPTTANSQTSFTINRTYTIAGGAAPSSFTIAYYASTDATFGNADDVLLGTETISAAADESVGTHTGVSPALTIPNGGTFYLIAQLNASNSFGETNTTNNVAQAPQTVLVTGPVILDNGQAGYSEAGSGWTDWSAGYNGSLRYHAAGTGADTASWQATGLPAGYYTIRATWNGSSNHASNAPYSIYDGTTLLKTVIVNQQPAPSGSTTLGGVVFQDLGTVNMTSGTLRVVLSDNANGYVVADAVQLVPIPAPTTDLNWSGGGISGPTAANSSTPFTVNRTYTISGTNVVPNFTIAYYASTDQVFGNADDVLVGTETISAAADKTAGTHSGVSPALTIPSGGTYYLFAMVDSTDAVLETDETNNVAQAPQAVVVTGPVLVDNGQPGYSESGSGWVDYAAGYNGGLRFHAPGGGADTATWQATGLPAGFYTVQATWNGSSNHASNAPYAIYDGNTLLQTVIVNQQSAPSGNTTLGGVVFQDLASVHITSGTIRVVLSDNVNGYVVADAVRFAPPIVDLNWSGGGISSQATASTQTSITINRSYNISGASVTPNFTIAYYASTDTTFGNADDVLLGTETISAAADKAVGVHTGVSPSLFMPTGGTYYLFAMVDSGGAVAETDETNNVVMASQPLAVTVPVIVDDGQAGYSETGSGWTSWAAGYGGNLRYHAAGTGADTVSWQTTGLASGYYTVQATWNGSSNHASNAPYSIYDGNTLRQTVIANQQAAPSGLSVGGVVFQDLATVQVTSGTLRIVLSDNVNGYVVADAVHIVPVPSLTVAGPVVLENGQPGYVESGPSAWVDYAAGYNSGLRYHAPGGGADTAGWMATGLPAGSYTVQATWNGSSNHASNAPYAIYDGNTLLQTVLVDQRPGPSGTTVGGAVFQNLATVQITSGTLRVVLSDNVDGYVVADAVRLVPANGQTFIRTQVAVTAQQQIALLITQVNALVTNGVLSNTDGSALTTKLNAAVRYLNAGNKKAAVTQLNSFISQVNTYVKAGKLTSVQAKPLLDAAQMVIASV